MELCLLLLSILIYVSTFNENSATVLSARCTSRCLAKEIETFGNITTIPECGRQDCSACMKPCQEEKKGLLSCKFLCGSFLQVESKNVCKESCRFVKHLNLEDHSNSSCPTGVSESECVLMRPENVKVSAHETKKELGKFTISWNGTWPLNTVFVLMSRWHKKGAILDSSQGWQEIKQTTLQSVTLDVKPLLWHQFKVLAANQYTISHFSVPTKMEFASLRRIGPPREFRVLSMQTIKDFAEVDVSWRKPDDIYELPIHRYKLSWSRRPDIHLEKFESFQVTDKRIKGNIHKYTITELQPNKTYYLELHAVIRQNEKRLRIRSSRVTLTIRTPLLTEDNIKKKIIPKKKTEMTKNSITSSKENSKVKSVVTSKPTMQSHHSIKTVWSDTSQATTPTSNYSRVEESNLEARKSDTGLINALGLKIDLLIALAVMIMCYL